MEEKLAELQKSIHADFWLDKYGCCIYSDILTLYPKDLKLILKLDLIVDTYMSGFHPRLRFFYNH